MQKILAIDVGGGTQDILLYEEGKPMENCIQLVLPAQTVVVAGKIKAATAAGKDVFLSGELMGGGASVGAIKNHLKKGLKVFATAQAAKTIRDDLGQVRAMGVELVEDEPCGPVEKIFLQDIVPDNLEKALAPFAVELPGEWAVAVQDHGESPPGVSDREFRFRYWQQFLQNGGDIRQLLYREPPEFFTRMKAVQRGLPGVRLADTGAAAVWGALCDPQVEEHMAGGLTVVNIGNQHTIAFLLRNYRVWGLFEHHTGLLDTIKLKHYLGKLLAGTLTHEEIFNDNGHGCCISPDYPGQGDFSFTAVTGPQRHLLAETGYYRAVPYGNMMLSGCYGLVRAMKSIKL